MVLNRPQNIVDFKLNIGYYLPRPQDIFPQNISPGVFGEKYDEGGVMGAVKFDNTEDGDGFVEIIEG